MTIKNNGEKNFPLTILCQGMQILIKYIPIELGTVALQKRRSIANATFNLATK